MALYKNRLELQRNIRYNLWEALFPFNYLKYYIQQKKLFKPMFDRVIENMVHDALKRGETEIRFYEDEGNVYFESLKELHQMYCKEYNLTGKAHYNKQLFEKMFELLQIYFSHYQWKSPDDTGKKDLRFDIIEEFEDFREEFIRDKKYVQNSKKRRYIRIVLIGGKK